jgi:RNA-directed DNA polymerase
MTLTQQILSLAKSNKQLIVKYFSEHNILPYSSLSQFYKHELNALYLHTVKKPAELCVFLKTPLYPFESLINNPCYNNFQIKKKRGSFREIYSPDKKLRKVQRRLNYFLQAYYLWIKPSEVYGFVVHPDYLGPYCNIVANAQVHVGKKYVLNMDLKDFFPSISAKRVKDVFSSPLFDFEEQIAIALTLLTTYEGKLPIGAPSSPVISNFICLGLDSDLKLFSEVNGLTYSRYADDLTFSSDFVISNDDILDIILIIKKNNFEVNEKKLHLKTANQKQTVTGLIVNDKVNIDRKFLKKIRAMLHDLTKNGLLAAVKNHFSLEKPSEIHYSRFINRLQGYINFVGQVRGKTDVLYLKYKTEFDTVLESINFNKHKPY